MRIGILTHNYPLTKKDRSSAGIFIYDLVKELKKYCQVFIFTPKFKGNEKLGDWKIYNPLTPFKFLMLINSGSKEYEHFLKQKKIDFSLSFWALPAGVWAYYGSKKLGIPYGVYCLGSDINQFANIPILKQLIKKSSSNASLRLANSYSIKQKVEFLTSLDCIYLPAITKINVNKAKKVFKKESFDFLYVGRLEKIKGIDLLIQAVKILQNSGFQFRLNILGDGSLFKSLKQQTKDFGLNNQVNFLGQASEAQVLSYMLSSDCLVIPSRSESLPLVLIEAAKCGLPIISTKVGDSESLINKFRTGYLVKEIIPPAIAQTMKQALKDGKEIRIKFKDNLKKLAGEFNFNQSVKTHYRLISQVTD